MTCTEADYIGIFTCAMSRDILVNPVLTETGHSYSQEYWDEYKRVDGGDRDPQTRQLLIESPIPDGALGKIISQFEMMGILPKQEDGAKTFDDRESKEISVAQLRIIKRLIDEHLTVLQSSGGLPGIVFKSFVKQLQKDIRSARDVPSDLRTYFDKLDDVTKPRSRRSPVSMRPHGFWRNNKRPREDKKFIYAWFVPVVGWAFLVGYGILYCRKHRYCTRDRSRCRRDGCRLNAWL